MRPNKDRIYLFLYSHWFIIMAHHLVGQELEHLFDPEAKLRSADRCIARILEDLKNQTIALLIY